MQTKYTSKVQQFLSKYKLLKAEALDEMGNTGVDNIKDETPVDTGALKDANDYRIENNIVYFINNQEYAPFVELGTSKMSAQPFMRTGINKSKGEFWKIIVNNLKI